MSSELFMIPIKMVSRLEAYEPSFTYNDERHVWIISFAKAYTCVCMTAETLGDAIQKAHDFLDGYSENVAESPCLSTSSIV